MTTDEQFQALIDGIKRQSPMIVDAALPLVTMTQEELRRLYEEVGKHYMMVQAIDEYMPTVGDLFELE